MLDTAWLRQAIDELAAVIWADQVCQCGATLHFINQPEHERVIVQHGENPEAIYMLEVLYPDLLEQPFRAWLDSVHTYEVSGHVLA